jgi:hypothetical protein
MQVNARRREPRDLGKLTVSEQMRSSHPVRVVAPGVCYILADPQEIARVLAAYPAARVVPLERRLV